MNRRFPFGRTLLLGFGFFGISLIWPIFNNFVSVFLREEFGLSATYSPPSSAAQPTASST